MFLEKVSQNENLNVNENMVYIDNTLGHWVKIYDFYLIKYINKNDFFNVDTIFTEYRKEIQTKLPLYIQILTNCKF